MLSLLKLSPKNDGLSKDEDTSLLKLVHGFIQYLKNIKIFDTVLPTDNTHFTVTEKETSEPKGLFPTAIQYDNDLLKNTSAVSCSTTEQPSKLLKYENVDGLVKWKFEGKGEANHQQHSLFNSITSPFLTSTGSTVSGGEEYSPLNNLQTGHINSPSPIAMNQINQMKFQMNSDSDSNHSLEEDLAEIPDLPNPEFFEVGVTPSEQHEDQLSDESSSNENSFSPKSKDKDNKLHTCQYCGAEFRIRGYLTRHIKKHAITKAYECPFFQKGSDNQCHPNGGFSRRDTYKTHLKARHFRYPEGTKSQDRATTSGKCGLCSKPYENNEEWVEKHIETGECEGLPTGFNIRVKNSRKKNYEFPNLQSENTPSNANTPHSIHSLPSDLKTTTNDYIRTLNENEVHDPKIGFVLNNVSNFEDFENNDEFSLDIEQCAYRPIVL